MRGKRLRHKSVGWVKVDGQKTTNLNRLAPRRNHQAVPARRPKGPKHAGDSGTTKQVRKLTHGTGRPRSGIPGRRWWLHRPDPRHPNSLPSLKRSKTAAGTQAGTHWRVEKSGRVSRLPDPDQESVPEPELKPEAEPDPITAHPQPPSPRS